MILVKQESKFLLAATTLSFFNKAYKDTQFLADLALSTNSFKDYLSSTVFKELLHFPSNYLEKSLLANFSSG